jgi:hypothetical protein
MEPLTNRALRWRGDTTSVTVRLPNPVVEFIDTHLDKTIRNRSEYLQHWAQVGMRGEEAEVEADVSHARHARRVDTPPPPPPPEPAPEVVEVSAVVATSPQTGNPALDEVYSDMLEGFRNRIK